MFTALLLSTAMGLPSAPIPKQTPTTGPAPYILNLASEKDGKVRLTIPRTKKEKVTVAEAVAAPGGAQVVQTKEVEVTVMSYVQVAVSELKDLKVYRADGKEIEIKDAIKKLDDGGLFVVSANGQKVDSSYLKLFKDDTLILVSPELVPQGNAARWGNGIRTMPGDPLTLPFPVPIEGFPLPMENLTPAQPVPPPEAIKK